VYILSKLHRKYWFYLFNKLWYSMTLVFKLMGPIIVKCSYVCMEWV